MAAVRNVSVSTHVGNFGDGAVCVCVAISLGALKRFQIVPRRHLRRLLLAAHFLLNICAILAARNVVLQRSHICAILVFCVLMLNNVPNMWRAGMIALTSTHHKNGDGDAIGELIEETLASSLSPHLVTRCNTLQHAATRCNTPATHGNTRQRTATHGNTAYDYCTALLQHTVTRCNTLQCMATHCNTLQHPAT